MAAHRQRIQDHNERISRGNAPLMFSIAPAVMDNVKELKALIAEEIKAKCF